MTYLYFATLPETSGLGRRVGDCTPATLGLLLLVLTLPGVVALVCAANMAGRRQRHALAIAETIGAVWIVLAVLTRVLAPGPRALWGSLENARSPASAGLPSDGENLASRKPCHARRWPYRCRVTRRAQAACR